MKRDWSIFLMGLSSMTLSAASLGLVVVNREPAPGSDPVEVQSPFQETCMRYGRLECCYKPDDGTSGQTAQPAASTGRYPYWNVDTGPLDSGVDTGN